MPVITQAFVIEGAGGRLKNSNILRPDIPLKLQMYTLHLLNLYCQRDRGNWENDPDWFHMLILGWGLFRHEYLSEIAQNREKAKVKS